MEKMLIFAPHIDDAEFGVGGWIARAKREGLAEAHVLVAFSGNSYVRSDRVRVTYDDRKLEMNRAMKTLGVVSWRSSEWFPENSGYTVDYPLLVNLISDHIEETDPTEVFVCLPSFNQDHKVLFDAVVTALRPGMHPRVKHVWAYEYPGNAWGSERPAWGRAYLELTPGDVQLKMDSLNCHETQFKGRTVAVAPWAAHAMMLQRGAEIGVTYAECVYLLRESFLLHRPKKVAL